MTARLRALVQLSHTHAAAQVRAALLRRGALLVEAPSVSQPPAYAPAFSPGLLVADLTDEGVELAATLRGSCGTSALLLTTAPNQRLVCECVEIDAAAVLMLPIDERQLAVTLQFVAARHRLGGATAHPMVFSAGSAHHTSDDTVPEAAMRLLRPRERDVVALLLQHKRVPAILEGRMNMSRFTLSWRFSIAVGAALAAATDGGF